MLSHTDYVLNTHTYSHLSLSIPISISSAVSEDLVCEGVWLADGDIKVEDTERSMCFMGKKQMYLRAIL